jgi:hypothetical protein
MFPKEKELVEINTIFGDIVLTYHKCPQISTPIKVEIKAIETEKKPDIMNIINSNFININKFTPHIFDKFIDIVIQM